MSKDDLQKAIKDTITKYKEIIVGVECLNERQNQHVIQEVSFMKDTVMKLAWDSLVMHVDMIIDKRPSEVLGRKDDYKDKFQVNFIVIIDHKVGRELFIL